MPFFARQSTDFRFSAASSIEHAAAVVLANLYEVKIGSLLHWAVVFLVVALVAALFGFGGVADTAMEGARLLFWVAIVLFVVSVVISLVRRGRV